MSHIKRRATPEVLIGSVKLGSGNPIVVQSMTNTDTSDVPKTIEQIKDLTLAGSELVRVTVNNEEAAMGVPRIVDGLDKLGIHTPIIGDFHYNGHLLLKKFPACARTLAKYRINPGNCDIGKDVKDNFATMIEVALENNKPIRIGANWGSLDKVLAAKLMDENSKKQNPLTSLEIMQMALIRSALESADQAQRLGLSKDKIIVSAKISEVQGLIQVYRQLSKECDYVLHLGLTEAGMGTKGVVASTSALSVLLQEGIGDTIRVSITPTPGSSLRTEEVRVAQQILQSLDIRHFTAQVTSCPGCGRTTSTFFQTLAQEVQNFLDENRNSWTARRPSSAEMKVAVMGCIVNGPGESKNANIGISLPGTAESPKAPVYIDGKLAVTLQGENIIPEFKKLVHSYVESHY